jgi:hypothetical protein
MRGTWYRAGTTRSNGCAVIERSRDSPTGGQGGQGGQGRQGELPLTIDY